MRLIQTDYEEGYHEGPLYREPPESQRNRGRLALLREYLSGGSLLEIGCGMGGFLRLAEKHFAVEGIDISRHAVNRIKRYFGQRVWQSDIEVQSLSRAYNVITVFNVLEHMHRPAAVIEKLYNALENGGVLIGSVPNNFGLVGSVSTRAGNYFDRTHVSTFPPEVWRGLFERVGFGTPEFFGEVTITRAHALYLRGRFWPWLSFNLMFVCRK
jgi:2-polyprenyl-3-methyl-5-hydroxy-6-metoxy-1,4-benzoquinol methylase